VSRTLRKKKRNTIQRKMTEFLHDRMRMSSLVARIEEVVASRLWSNGIGSDSTVVYLQPSDSRWLTVQEMQRKWLGMLDVIGDTRSKEKKFPLIILNFRISIISNTSIRDMSAHFHLELIFKSWLWTLVVLVCFVISIS
jgi:hypothetical protein